MTDKDDLRAAAGSAPWYVLHCPSCTDTTASSHQATNRYPWAIRLSCAKCSKSWWVCTTCGDQRAHLQTTQQLSRHNRVKHLKPLEQTTTPTADAPNTASTTEEPKVVMETKYITREASRVFFAKSQEQEGITYLVKKAAFQENETSHVEVDSDDVDTFMTTAYFISTITRTQRENLAKVIRMNCETTVRHHVPKFSDSRNYVKPVKRLKSEIQPTTKINVLQTKEQIRSQIVDGKHALFKNLAHPDVKQLDGHAYILPSEAIADFLGHGLADIPNTYDPQGLKVQALGKSESAQNLITENAAIGTRTLIGGLWSDGFEPNYKIGNRGSAWIMTMTLQSPDMEKIGMHNVYPIAVGLESDDHREVEKRIWDDIRSIQPVVKLYNAHTQQNEDISFHVLSISQDQPERREQTCLLRGNSTNHGRFGCSAYVKQITPKIRPCRNCLSQMERVQGDSHCDFRECRNCLNWMRQEGDIEFDPGEPNFPTEELSESGKIPFRRLTFESLTAAVEKTHNKIITHRWDKNEAVAYLQSWCIPKKHRLAIIECAENCRILESAIRENNRRVIDALAVEKERHPDKYRRWHFPPIWTSGLQFLNLHETPMHLLFLGITQSLTMQFQEWAVLRKKYQALRRTLLTLTSKIEKKHLSWCRANGYRGEKLGGWISENYLAFSRLFPWVYSAMDSLADDPAYQPPNNKPQSNWTKDENVSWLRSRLLPTNGNAAEVRQRVAHNWHRPAAPPTGGPLKEVRQVVVSWWSLVCHLMGMTEGSSEQENVTSRLVRLFLTKIFDHDASTSEALKRKLPMWHSQYNFLSLLNLPEQIRQLGPVRNRWDGGPRGEKFVMRAKPNIKSIKAKNWDRNLILNLLRQRELLVLQGERFTGESDVDETSTESEIPADVAAYTTYRSYSDIVRDIGRQEPLSCLVSRDENNNVSLFCCYRGQHRSQFVMQLLINGEARYRFGMFYFDVQLAVEDEARVPLTEVKITSYGLLLPCLYELLQSRYALIDSHWRTLNGEKKLVLPHHYIQREYGH